MGAWSGSMTTPSGLGCVNLSHGAREAVLMSKFNPFEFVQEVRQEVSKVTWPTRKETLITTAMVFVMVVLASVFFLLVDQVVGWGVRTIIGIGG